MWVVLRGDGLHGLVGYDPGVYYAAAAAFVHGLRPYGGFLLLHPPGSMLVLSPFAALGSVTSDSTGMAVARFAVILLGTLNAILVTRIAHRFGLAAAITGGLFYALWAPVVVVENQTRLEPLGNTCLLLALLFLLRRGRPVSAGAEVLAGLAPAPAPVSRSGEYCRCSWCSAGSCSAAGGARRSGSPPERS